jgi:membrane-associated phospholipid phosphatase
MTLFSLYKQNKPFFIGFFLFVIASAFVLIFFSKADGFYLLNSYHTNFLTTSFIRFTYLGDGFFCVGVGLLLFIFKQRYLALMVLSSYIISGIIAQVLKYFIIEARPAVFLKESTYQYFINDVTLHNLHSFPSGHSVSTFAMAAVLSFYLKNKNYSMLFLAIAILIGYSRIYLAQHFLDDVLSGALIGFVSAIFCWIFFDKIFKRFLNRKVNFQKRRL